MSLRNYDLSDNKGFKFIMDNKNRIGKIKNLNEMGNIVKFLFYVIFQKYDRISIIIDELENLSESPLAERYQFSDLIKMIYDSIPIRLNIILIYTWDTYSVVENTLQRALTDRIKDVIEFKLIDNIDDIHIYIKECIEKRGKVNSNDFIEESVIAKFSNYLINNYKKISFRDINKEVQDMISLCYKLKIESEKYHSVKFKIDEKLYTFYNNLIKKVVKMVTNILIIPDECLFKSLINCEYEPDIINDIEKLFGPMAVLDDIYNDIISNELPNKIDEYFLRQSWELNLKQYYDNYYRILMEICDNKDITLDAIKKELSYDFNYLSKKLKIFNAGIADVDINLVVNALYFKNFTKYMPIIISDDSDILLHTQLISSYFGLSIIYISMYETLKLLKNKDVLDEYLSYKDIDDVCVKKISQNFKFNYCMNNMVKFTDKCLLSFHPNISSETDLKLMLRWK